jgi:hypothetical protein
MKWYLFGWSHGKNGVGILFMIRPSNRGNKLKRTTHTLLSSAEQETEYVHFGRQRAIVRKAPLIDDDPYSEIKLERIWPILNNIQDIKKSPLFKTLLSRHCRLLSDQIFDFYSPEKELLKQLNRLQDLFFTVDLGLSQDQLEKAFAQFMVLFANLGVSFVNLPVYPYLG